jgi:molybdate/tungstate transport system ATP-binding protein
MMVLDQVTVAAGSFELRGVSFTVPTGSYAALMGRTGSGKTTLLEAICGLRAVTSGRILLHGRDVTRLPPADRGIGFVPQEGALFSHLTVREHLAFALVIRKQAPDTIRARVDELASWLGLEALLDRRPQGLSGGETQRVALGRALSFRPEILCLDEPLSALDDETREATCAVLESLRARTGVTVLHITHNLAEADRLADVRLRIRNGNVLPDRPETSR